MPDPITTPIDTGSIVLSDSSDTEFAAAIFEATGAGVVPAGTLLAHAPDDGGAIAPPRRLFACPGWTDAATFMGPPPVSVLAYDLTCDGAGDVPFRLLVSGRVAATRLRFEDGTPVSAMHLSVLESFGVFPEDVLLTGG